MKLITPIAVLIAAASATAGAAQSTAKSPAPAAPATKAPVPTPPRNDATCLLVSNIFAQQSTDATQKAHAGNVFFYYFGRLDARATEAQWKNELKQAGTTQFTAESASALMNSCVQNMQARAQVLQNTTQQLDQRK